MLGERFAIWIDTEKRIFKSPPHIFFPLSLIMAYDSGENDSKNNLFLLYWCEWCSSENYVLRYGVA